MLDLSGINGAIGGVLTEHGTNHITKKPRPIPRGTIARIEAQGDILAIFAGEHEKRIGFDRRFWKYTLEDDRRLQLTWRRPEDTKFSDIKEPPVNKYTVYLKP